MTWNYGSGITGTYDNLYSVEQQWFLNVQIQIHEEQLPACWVNVISHPGEGTVNIFLCKRTYVAEYGIKRIVYSSQIKFRNPSI